MGRFQWLEFENATKSSTVSAAAESKSPELLSLEFQEKADDYFFMGLFDKALREYCRVTAENRLNLRAWVRQIDCQIALGSFQQARTWALKICELFPDNAQTLCTLAYATSFLNHSEEEVRQTLERFEALAHGQYGPEMYFERGVCHFALNEEEAGRNDFTSLIECEASARDHLEWIQRIAAFYLSKQAAINACSLLEILASDNKLTAYTLSMLIKAKWLLGERNQVRSLLKDLHRADPLAAAVYEVQEYMNSHTPQSRADGLCQSLFKTLGGLFSGLQ